MRAITAAWRTLTHLWDLIAHSRATPLIAGGMTAWIIWLW